MRAVEILSCGRRPRPRAAARHRTRPGTVPQEGMAAMKTYRVRYELDEAGYWLASVLDVPGCHTQGRSLGSARGRVRDALAVCVDDADAADLAESYKLPRKPALAVALRAVAAKQRAERAQSEAQRMLSEAVRQLLDAKLSHRDAALRAWHLSPEGGPARTAEAERLTLASVSRRLSSMGDRSCCAKAGDDRALAWGSGGLICGKVERG